MNTKKLQNNYQIFSYTRFGMLTIAGFADPMEEPEEADLLLWMPDPKNPPTDLAQAQARFLLTQVGDQFCDLLAQENDARKEHMSDGKTMFINIF